MSSREFGDGVVVWRSRSVCAGWGCPGQVTNQQQADREPKRGGVLVIERRSPPANDAGALYVYLCDHM